MIPSEVKDSIDEHIQKWFRITTKSPFSDSTFAKSRYMELSSVYNEVLNLNDSINELIGKLESEKNIRAFEVLRNTFYDTKSWQEREVVINSDSVVDDLNKSLSYLYSKRDIVNNILHRVKSLLFLYEKSYL